MKCVLLLIILFSMSCTKMTELFNSSDPLGTPISRQKDQDEENGFKNSADPVGGLTSFFFATAAASESDLPECNTGMIGKIYYVTTGRVFKACTSGGWEAIDVRGPKGETGATGTKGEKGDVGPVGDSVSSATVNGLGELVLTLSDSSTMNAGNVKGEKGDKGDIGPRGDSGVEQTSNIDSILRYTVKAYDATISDEEKDSACKLEYGEEFEVASVMDLLMILNRVPLIGESGYCLSDEAVSSGLVLELNFLEKNTYQFDNCRVTGTNGEYSSRQMHAKLEVAKPSSLVCVYKNNSLRVSRSTVADQVLPSGLDTICKTDFGDKFSPISRKDFLAGISSNVAMKGDDFDFGHVQVLDGLCKRVEVKKAWNGTSYFRSVAGICIPGNPTVGARVLCSSSSSGIFTEPELKNYSELTIDDIQTLVNFTATGVKKLPAGGYIVVGNKSRDGISSDMELFIQKLAVDGSPDFSFGENGVFSVTNTKSLVSTSYVDVDSNNNVYVVVNSFIGRRKKYNHNRYDVSTFSIYSVDMHGKVNQSFGGADGVYADYSFASGTYGCLNRSHIGGSYDGNFYTSNESSVGSFKIENDELILTGTRTGHWYDSIYTTGSRPSSSSFYLKMGADGVYIDHRQEPFIANEYTSGCSDETYY